VAAVGDVGVELVAGSREALGVALALAGSAVAHQQRAGLEQVTARARGELATARDPRQAALHVDARADLLPRGGERHVPPHHAVRAHLAERCAALAHEEAADNGLTHTAGGTPGLEALLSAQQRDPHLGGLGVVGGDVDGRARAVGESQPRGLRPPVAGIAEGRGERAGHGGSVTLRGRVHVNML